MRVERKPARTAHELQAEMNLRLRAAGHDIEVGLPRPSRGSFVAGRNWEPDLPSALPAAVREAAITIARLVGNEFDCAWPRCRPPEAVALETAQAVPTAARPAK